VISSHDNGLSASASLTHSFLLLRILKDVRRNHGLHPAQKLFENSKNESANCVAETVFKNLS
jgi:hypothetical protein